MVVDFDGTIDGQPFQGGQGKDVAIVVGSGQVLAGFRRRAARRCGGREQDRDGHVPARTIRRKDLAGKTAEFAITVQRVEEQVLPELDDAFAASFGVGTGKSPTSRRRCATTWSAELTERLKNETKTRAFDALISANRIRTGGWRRALDGLHRDREVGPAR